VQRNAIGLCTAKDCRGRDEFGEVRRILAERCTVVELSCLDICKGPVAVLHPPDAEPVVVKRLRSRKAALAAARYADTGGELPARLRDRQVTGSKRTRAVRRARPKTTPKPTPKF
jgi:hypothetical protein